MVGIDSLGLARGKNHLIFDKYAADHDIYVIENLTKLNEIPVGKFKVYCMPIKIEALDALPARVLVEF